MESLHSEVTEQSQVLHVLVKMIAHNFEDLPPEILLDILLRLPVESLGRLTCTSKFWYSMISDSNFVDMHLNHRIRNPGYLFAFTGFDPELIFMERVGDIIEGMKFCLGRLEYRAEKDTYSDHYKSSGGLMAYYLDMEKCYCICNPITAEQVKVPHDPQYNYDDECDDQIWWGFSYCMSTREYKLVQVTRPLRENISRGAIYTLGSQSWREIPNFPFMRHVRSFTECNGTLFWLVLDYIGGNSKDIRRTLWSIDMETEKLRCLQGPPILAPELWYYLVRFGDTISCVMKDKSSYTIWILKDKENETWINGYTFRDEVAFDFWGLWTNGELFGTSHEKETCVAYDPVKKEFRAVIPSCRRLYKLPKIPRNVFFHAGSLVSPTRVKDVSCW